MVNALTTIELGQRTLNAVTARVNGQGPQIVASVSAPLAGADAASVRAALKECGVEGPRAALVIPRGQAILRDLELPAGTPEELVAMVRFQVEREMPLPLDQIRYTYVETSRAAGKVRIQVTAVPREVIDPAVAALEGAGLKVDRATISSFGLLSLCRNEGLAALVEVSGGEAEILVADRGRMEFSHTAPLPDGFSPDAVAEEVGRTLLAFAARFPGREVRKVVLAGEGDAAAELAMHLRHRLSCEVTQAGPGDLETAPAAGLALGLLRGDAVPDLLHPPTAEKKFRLTRGHRIAGLAAAILLLLFVWSQVALSGRRDALARKRARLGELEPQAADLAKMKMRTQVAHQWYADRNTFLPVLMALRNGIHNTENLWITTAVFDEAGLIRVQGKAKDDNHVHALVASLMATKLFRDVKTEGARQNNDKGDYRRDFSFTAHLAGSVPGKK